MAKQLIFNLSPSEFDTRKKELEKNNIHLSDDREGIIRHDTPVGEVAVHYVYDGVNTLIVEVAHKPWIVKESMINDKITEWFGTKVV